jgi:hypothetical protein
MKCEFELRQSTQLVCRRGCLQPAWVSSSATEASKASGQTDLRRHLPMESWPAADTAAALARTYAARLDNRRQCKTTIFLDKKLAETLFDEKSTKSI